MTRMALDAVDAVLTQRKSQARTRGPYRRRTVADVVLQQLTNLRTIQRRYTKVLQKLAVDELPSPEFVQAQTQLTTSIVNLERSLRMAKEAQAKAQGGLSTEQLYELLETHLAKIAPNVVESTRRLCLAAWFGAEVADRLLALPVEGEVTQTSVPAPEVTP